MSLREIQKQNVFLNIADELSRLGTCDRKRVGAVIVRDGRCITWGFNGAPPGAPHCEENYHGYDNSEDLIDLSEEARDYEIRRTRAELEAVGCRNATHAEANALAFAARQGISTEGGTCYVTVSPCEVCARLLIAAGIVAVFYNEEYRDTRGIEILRATGIASGSSGDNCRDTGD